MTNKLINFFKQNKVGLGAGALVGLAASIFYQLSGGDFMFAVANIQGRAGLSDAAMVDLISLATIISWIIVGAFIGLIIDIKFGFNFSKSTKKTLLIVAGILLVYTLFGDVGTGSREAGAFKYFQTLTKSSNGFLFFAGIIITSLFSFFKSLIVPQSSIPIWIFFVAGFAILLMLRRRGGGEQPIIIQR